MKFCEILLILSLERNRNGDYIFRVDLLVTQQAASLDILRVKSVRTKFSKGSPHVDTAKSIEYSSCAGCWTALNHFKYVFFPLDITS